MQQQKSEFGFLLSTGMILHALWDQLIAGAYRIWSFGQEIEGYNTKQFHVWLLRQVRVC